MEIAPIFYQAGCKVIDLSADFRLADLGTYEQWYGKHKAPEVIPHAVYGIPELWREQIKGSPFHCQPRLLSDERHPRPGAPAGNGLD